MKKLLSKIRELLIWAGISSLKKKEPVAPKAIVRKKTAKKKPSPKKRKANRGKKK